MRTLSGEMAIPTARLNKGLPALHLSSYTQLERPTPIRGFAIKYVLRGVERYTVDGQAHPVGAGQYLLANSACETRVLIDDAEPVLGMCIDLPAALLDEVAHGWVLPEAFADRADSSFFMGPEFLEGVRDALRSTLGPMLQRLAAALFEDPAEAHLAGTGLYYALAERVVDDHTAVVPRLRAIRAVRASTRKDIYRRVQRARELMDAHLDQPMPVELMAREAAMSPYHFFRAFRAMEGLSPHQYRLMRRLEAARALLATGRIAVQEVALLTGFADAASFSKSFRKWYGHVPSGSSRSQR